MKFGPQKTKNPWVTFASIGMGGIVGAKITSYFFKDVSFPNVQTNNMENPAKNIIIENQDFNQKLNASVEQSIQHFKVPCPGR